MAVSMRPLTKFLLVLCFLVLFVLPARGAECSAWDIVYEGNTPLLTQPDDSYRGFRVSAVGTYLWANFDEGEILSIEIPVEAIAVSVCANGDVTFTYKPQPVETETTHKPHPVEETTNLLDYYQSLTHRFY